MKTASSKSELREIVRQWKRAGQIIGLVPTMGYFHKGHISLMERCRELADKVVVSIFVNPAQFGPEEDLDRYPRDIERDLSLSKDARVDLVFVPDAMELYPPGFQTWVVVEEVSQGLCGASRPGHFRGVATIVAKLFNIVQPDLALFGEKDYQQLQVIRQMVRDLDFPVEVVGHPTVREVDGLAMSSRNSYLSPSQRQTALCLKEALDLAEEMIHKGEQDAEIIKKEMAGLIQGYPETRIDYIVIAEPDTLTPMERVDLPAIVALAVFVGETRLIDNRLFH